MVYDVTSEVYSAYVEFENGSLKANMTEERFV